MYLCPHCAQPVKRTRSGRVARHLLTVYSDLQCKGEGAQPVRSTGGQASEVIAADRTEATHELPAPDWLPAWRQRHLASLALPASGDVRIWLPYTTSLGHRAAIGTMMPTATKPLWDGQRTCWTAPKGHFLTLSNRLLQRHGHLILGREYRPGERCNARCKSAEGPFCICSCRAKYHGHGRWMKNFVTVDEFGTTYRNESWHWRVATSAH